MPKPPSVIAFDVLVLGDHPSAYLAATLLKHKAKLRVGHAELESPDSDDRLVTINPALFDLHPLLSGMGRKLPTTGVYGIRFLADQPDTSSESRGANRPSYARPSIKRSAIAWKSWPRPRGSNSSGQNLSRSTAWMKLAST